MYEKHPRDSYLSVKVGVWLPFLQALATALFIGAVAMALLYLLKIAAVLLLSALFAAIAAAAVWLTALRWWREMVSSIDGKIEKIPLYSYVEPDALPEPQSVRVELVQSDGRAGSYIELPVSPSKLRALASGLMAGKAFTEAVWCGSGGIFTRGEFAKLRDEMLRRKLLVLNSPSTPARGYSFTAGGKAALRYLAESTTPPLLTDGDGIPY